MSELSHCVYKHTFPNGKVYIGMAENPYMRFGNNGINYEENTSMYNDIKKFGWKNIKTEILMGGLSIDDAKQKEKGFILAYNSENPNFGYNRTNFRQTILNCRGKEIDKTKKQNEKNIIFRGKNMNFDKFVEPEIEYILENGNFNERQRIIFELRTKGITLNKCAKEIGVSVSTISRNEREIRSKIEKLMKN